MLLLDIRNAAISTVVAEIGTLPICTVKTNFQNSGAKSWFEIVKKLYSQGGVGMFYRASPAAIASQVISTSTKFGPYRYITKNYPDVPLPLAGFACGFCSSIMTHPIDIVKTHMQMNTPFMPEVRKHGIVLFYRGYSKTFFKVAVSSPLFFPLTSKFKKVFEGNEHGRYLAPLCASFISTVVMQPLDYLKTRHMYGLTLYTSSNPLTYFKGLGLNLFRIVPHFTILMTCLDLLGSPL